MNLAIYGACCGTIGVLGLTYNLFSRWRRDALEGRVTDNNAKSLMSSVLIALKVPGHDASPLRQAAMEFYQFWSANGYRVMWWSKARNEEWNRIVSCMWEMVYLSESPEAAEYGRPFIEGGPNAFKLVSPMGGATWIKKYLDLNPDRTNGIVGLSRRDQVEAVIGMYESMYEGDELRELETFFQKWNECHCRLQQLVWHS